MTGCACCGRRRAHPSDRKFGYCAACRWFTGDPQLGPLHTPAQCAARNQVITYTALTLAAAAVIIRAPLAAKTTTAIIGPPITRAPRH